MDKEKKYFFYVFISLLVMVALTVSLFILYNGKMSLVFIIFVITSIVVMIFLSIVILNLRVRLLQKEKNIIKLISKDELTGLDNKRQFITNFKKEIERMERVGGKLTLITFDVDNLHAINEKFGDELGDVVLKTIAGLISDNVRLFDVVGRFGGDEIYVGMIDASGDDGVVVAERCRKEIEENKYYFEGKTELTVTVSAGIAYADIQGSNNHDMSLNIAIYKKLFAESRKALDLSKKSGKNKSIKYQ